MHSDYNVLRLLNFIISEPTLNPHKTYEYKYEGMVNIGRDTPDLAESGVKLQCNFKITGLSIQTFLFQVCFI